MKSNVVNLLTNATMTGTATVNSAAISTDQLWGVAIQAFWTGTSVTGTLKLQASCDSPMGQNVSEGTFVPTNWTDITSSSSSVSGPGNFMWNVSEIAYRYIRLTYTNATNTGSLSANACLKGI